jgi:putative membrane protein
MAAPSAACPVSYTLECCDQARPAPPSREGSDISRDPHIGIPWRRNRFLRRLGLVMLAVTLLAAVAPHDRSDWLLENLLVFAAALLLVATHGRFVFSNLSYLLIFVFLCLHSLGAHYTYSLTPPGFWVQELLGLARNPYDRFVHFGFGLLLTYPLRELTLRRLHAHGLASYAIPLAAVLSLSASYEIVESWTARIVDPELGTAFLGTQGDEWDAQKDMSLALVGAALCLVATALYRRRHGREPWELFAPEHAA